MPLPLRAASLVSTVKNQATQPPSHHFVRTFFASLLGVIAVNLVLASILVVWLNRTLTDTETYVQTVAPLIEHPDVQNFIADKAADSIVRTQPSDEIASSLLAPVENATKNPEQKQAAVKEEVRDSVREIVSSPDFQQLWTDTNKSAHAGLVRQLNGSDQNLTLDLSPVVAGALKELESTKLLAVNYKIVIPEDAGKLNLGSGSVGRVHAYYQQLRAATITIFVLTVITIVLAILLSVEHMRTARRILLSTGIITLLSALLLQAPSLIKFNAASQYERNAAIAFANVLFQNLQTTLIIIGSVCLVLAIGGKIYSRYFAKNQY